MSIDENGAEPQHKMAEVFLKNSVRLIDDARFLFESRRFASATALAILGLEEFAKFLTMSGLLINSTLEKQLHTKKQTDVSGFVAYTTYVVAVAEHFGAKVPLRQLLDLRHKDGDEMTSAIRPYVRLDKANMDEGVLAEIMQSELMAKALRLSSSVSSGALNAMKNQALYADINADGSVHDPQTAITAAKAREIFELLLHVTKIIRLYGPTELR